MQFDLPLMNPSLTYNNHSFPQKMNQSLKTMHLAARTEAAKSQKRASSIQLEKSPLRKKALLKQNQSRPGYYELLNFFNKKLSKDHTVS